MNDVPRDRAIHRRDRVLGPPGRVLEPCGQLLGPAGRVLEPCGRTIARRGPATGGRDRLPDPPGRAIRRRDRMNGPPGRVTGAERRALRRHGGTIGGALLAIAAGILGGTPIDATAQAGRSEEIVTTAAGAQYRAGPLRRLILGRHYRDLWTMPVRVRVLDLDSVGGGLTPTRTGGGMQTRSLRFLGRDGREYAFRSVDKDPSAVLDSIFLNTVVDDLVQDGISAAHPFGALVAAPLLDAVGVLHVNPQLRVMPDDPRLGRFRAEFAGMLGLIEERPDENDGDRTSFRDTERVISSEALVERVNEGPNDRVDASAYLRARLMDVFLGDWDRHRGQWRWATYDDGAPRRWLPVPRDRDQAFSKFDGLATRIVSLYLQQFVRFDEEYPSLKRLHWNARALDRWILPELDRTAWDEIGIEVQASLTDRVIEQATRQLPLEIYEINGAELGATLRQRRDDLHRAWDELYLLMADKVDVHATDLDDVVLIDRSEQGSVRVTVSAPEESELPYFDRTFVTDETSEVRIYLGDGDDRVEVDGAAETGLLVRVVGQDGDDLFDVADTGDGLRLYDDDEGGRAVGPEAPAVDDKPFDEWVWTEEDRDQPLDWGRQAYPLFQSLYSTDLGLFVGGGVRLESYGFRKRNFATRFDVAGGYAPFVNKGRLRVDGRINLENSGMFWTVGGRVSRLDVLSYYGPGNDTPVAGPSSFHEVDVTSASASLGIGVEPAPWFRLLTDVVLDRTSTQDNAGRYFETLGAVYGSEGLVSLGVGGSLTFDPAVDDPRTGNRFRLRLHGRVFPEMLDVERTYGRSGGDVSVLLASSTWPRLALNVRGGGETVFGRFPWHQAAFLGGVGSVRGWDEQRFAGEASLWGSAEVRLRVFHPRVVVPVGVGVFGFADSGRVFLNSESPGGWRTGLGGGVFLHPVQQPYLVRFGLGTTDESTKLFVQFGLPY